MVSGSDPHIVCRLIQEDLNAIAAWCQTFRLTVNSEKTKVLWSHSDRNVPDLTECRLVLNGVTLKVVGEFNYLGVIIDTNLKLVGQCNKVKSSTHLKLYHLRKLRKIMDKKLSVLLFKQMILPVFDYCDFVLEGAADGASKGIQTIQNHCLRSCLRVRDPRTVSRVDIHLLCDCVKLKVRRDRNLLCIMYGVAGDPENVMIPPRVLRGHDKVKLKVRRSKGAIYDKSPLFRGACLWDKLESVHQKSATKAIFLSKM